MIGQAVKFVLWTIVVFVVLLFLLFMTQMGDCPEQVIDRSIGTACSTQKHLWGWGLLIVAAVAWVAGMFFIFRHRDDD